MVRRRVFVTRLMDRDALDAIAAHTEMVVWPEDTPPSPERLREALRGVDGVLTNIMDRLDGAAVEGASGLKVVSQLAAGVDNIDVAEMTRRGIPVGHTPGVLSKATADVAFALLMAVARRVVESDRWVRRGSWRMAFHPNYWLGADVSGATLGIVGMGKIGVEMVKRARGFDMRVLYYSRTRKPQDERRLGMEYAAMDRLLEESDFVSLHVPLTDETYHLIGEAELRKMRPTAILVNTARGPVVDGRAPSWSVGGWPDRRGRSGRNRTRAHRRGRPVAESGRRGSDPPRGAVPPTAHGRPCACWRRATCWPESRESASSTAATPRCTMYDAADPELLPPLCAMALRCSPITAGIRASAGAERTFGVSR